MDAIDPVNSYSAARRISIGEKSSNVPPSISPPAMLDTAFLTTRPIHSTAVQIYYSQLKKWLTRSPSFVSLFPHETKYMECAGPSSFVKMDPIPLEHGLTPNSSHSLTSLSAATQRELEEPPFMLRLASPTQSSWLLAVGHQKLGNFIYETTPVFELLFSSPLSIYTNLLPQLLAHLLTTSTPPLSSTALYSHLFGFGKLYVVGGLCFSPHSPNQSPFPHLKSSRG